MKIIDKAIEFLNLAKATQERKRRKLKKIISRLESAKSEARQTYKSQTNKKKKKRALKEYRALAELLKKSKKRLEAMADQE